MVEFPLACRCRRSSSQRVLGSNREAKRQTAAYTGGGEGIPSGIRARNRRQRRGRGISNGPLSRAGGGQRQGRKGGQGDSCVAARACTFAPLRRWLQNE